jgi:hypothetical protein
MSTRRQGLIRRLVSDTQQLDPSLSQLFNLSSHEN